MLAQYVVDTTGRAEVGSFKVLKSSNEQFTRAVELALEPVGEPPTPWFEAEIHRQLDMIDAAVREDPLKPFATSQFDQARGQMLNFTRDRAAFVRCELERGARRGCESVVGQ